MTISNRYSSLARPDLKITEYPFLIHSVEKGHPETPVRVWPPSNGRIKSYGHFEPLLKPGATRPQNHRVSIPHQLSGKGHLETPVRVWPRSKGRIKVMAISNRYSSLARLDLICKHPKELSRCILNHNVFCRDQCTECITFIRSFLFKKLWWLLEV